MIECVNDIALGRYEREQASHEASLEQYHAMTDEVHELLKEIADFVAPRVEKLACIVDNYRGDLKKATIYQAMQAGKYTILDLVREMNVIDDLLAELPKEEDF